MQPNAPQIELAGISPSGRAVLSEKGEGSGTYLVDGGLEAGQVLTMSASCASGDTVTITKAGTGSYSVDCTNPGSLVFFEAPKSETDRDVEVTVETAGGSPYWLAAWVHDAR